MSSMFKQWFTIHDIWLALGICWFGLVGAGWYRESHGLAANGDSATTLVRVADWVYSRSQSDLTKLRTNLLYAKEHPVIDWSLAGLFSIGVLAFTSGVAFTFSGYRQVVHLFGTPSILSTLLLLRLDTWRLRPFSAGSANASLGMFVVAFCLIGGSLYFWKETGLNCLLFLPPFGFVFLILRSLQAAYPPCVLILANSNLRAQKLRRAVPGVSHPLRVVSLLRSDDDPTSGKSHDADSFRTRESKNWRELVRHLMHMTPIIVLDIRYLTAEVDYECDMLLRDGLLGKTLVLKDEPGPFVSQESILKRITPLISPDQLFTERELLEYFRECLSGEKSFPIQCRIK